MISACPTIPSIHQPLFDGITDNFRVILHAHLGHYAGPVGADGLYAKGEPVGYFFDGHARCYHDHDLVFAIRETLMNGLFFIP